MKTKFGDQDADEPEVAVSAEGKHLISLIVYFKITFIPTNV